MFVEKVKSDGLAHLSYVIGDGGEAAVIDPRRDCEIYVDLAAKKGCRITHIFETHRNEDLVSGAPILGERTDAPVHHGSSNEVIYADTVRQGDEFTLGKLRLSVLESPGHTDDSISLAVHDTSTGGDAVAVFTGDALFVGDVGRTDFYPDRAEEMAGRLFDSLQALKALGDQAILYPAHGAGSVCGHHMADREFSTIGYERQNNPLFKLDNRDSFVAAKLAEHHYKPPYFRHMERLNSAGASPVGSLSPRMLSPAAFEAAAVEGDVCLDVRSVAAFLGAHLPGSLAMPAGMIPAFAGWFLSPEQSIRLIADNDAQARTAATHLARIGFDDVTGVLSADAAQWASGARPFKSMPVVDVNTVARRLKTPPKDWTLLDVRGRGEVEAGRIEGAIHIYVGELAARTDTLDRQHHHTVMCASGARATVAASILARAGFEDVDVFLGSMGAWQKANQPVSN